VNADKVKSILVLPKVFKAIWCWIWFVDLSCLLSAELLGRFFMSQILCSSHIFIANQHSLWQTAQCKSHPSRRHKQSLPPFVLSPDLRKKYANSDDLTVKMIRIIQYLHLFTMNG